MTKKELKKRRKELWKVLTQALAYNLRIEFARERGKGLILGEAPHTEDDEGYILLNEAYILPYGVTCLDMPESIRESIAQTVQKIKETPSPVWNALVKETK